MRDGEPELLLEVAPGQAAAWGTDALAEDPAYLSKQLLTYLGNKRALLAPIGAAVEKVKRRLGRQKLRVLDAFSGSGVVSRYLKAHATLLISNDLEEYAAVTARCYLSNRSEVDGRALKAAVTELNRTVAAGGIEPGFIAEDYAARNEGNIRPADRLFYTRANAARIDAYRRGIESADPALRDLLLGPLLSEASIHANTAGVFKGFYKDRNSGAGRFGGTGGDALSRIMSPIELPVPVLSRFECDYRVVQGDATAVARDARDLDLAYFDPPYNQHPYGSNYFMLNLIVRYERPARVSPVSGIPVDWRRSDYNVRSRALARFEELLGATDARFLLVSFNNEGFIPPGDMRACLGKLGTVEIVETRYNAFRGSRNLHGRDLHVTEQLFLVERGRRERRHAHRT